MTVDRLVAHLRLRAAGGQAVVTAGQLWDHFDHPANMGDAIREAERRGLIVTRRVRVETARGRRSRRLLALVEYGQDAITAYLARQKGAAR